MQCTGFLACAAIALSTAASAQDSEPPPTQYVRAVDAIEQAYIEKCGPDAETIEVDDGEVRHVALIRNQSGPVVIAACLEKSRVVYPLEVDTLSSALVFMAYKPFAPFWPYAEARWGDDLGKLRQRLAERARTASPAYSSYAVRPATAEAINRARRLLAIGYFDEAKAGLSARSGEILAGRKRKDRDKFDLVMLALTRASVERFQNGYGAAADYLAEFARTVEVGSDYATNLTINRAAYLAEGGRTAQALELLKPTYDLYETGVSNNKKAYQFGGSEREFSWILACSYAREGQAALAARYAAIVNSAEERPRDEYLVTTKPSSAIRMRMTRCMDDPEGYFAVWHDSRPAVLSYAWLDFQNGARVINGVARPWAARPEAAELGSKYRQLPERYGPALNMWQAAAAAAR